MLNCRQATRLLSESQDRSLSLGEKMGLRLHVLICTGCRHCKQNMNVLHTASKAYAKGASENKDE